MNEEVCPVEHLYPEQASGENRYRRLAIIRALKTKAEAAGPRNLLLPGD